MYPVTRVLWSVHKLWSLPPPSFLHFGNKWDDTVKKRKKLKKKPSVTTHLTWTMCMDELDIIKRMDKQIHGQAES